MKVKSFRRIFLISALLALLLCTTAFAARKEGWVEKGTSIRYYAVNEEGKSQPLTGLQKIGRFSYLFDELGVLQTGWQTTPEGFRYFRKSGAPGTIGRMFTGLRKVSGKLYYFNTETGVVRVGRHQIDGAYYYFSTAKTIRDRGAALTKRWVKYKGVLYYYGSTGKMLRNRWVKKTWYVGPDGQMLKDAISPDGYLLGEDGKKVGTEKVDGFVKLGGKYYYYDLASKSFLKSKWMKVDGKMYYLNADGVRVKGWRNIGNYRYHFDRNGVRQKGVVAVGTKLYYLGYHGRLQYNTTTPDGKYKVDANGVCTRVDGSTPRILIIAGHGQGDPGATSSWGQEAKYTREFAKLIYKKLSANPSVEVDFYKNGSLSYDCYQQQSATLRAAGLLSKLTGSGSVKKQVKKAIAANPNIPVFTDYDYVLEVHFNAKVNKDPQGDGSYTGIGFYVNSRKTRCTLEWNILRNVQALGFKIWAGVCTSPNLLNARVCQELGVSYGLLETAFIDDGDDMTFYSKNKNKMAQQVASTILSYFS